jgi:hypothetical protein
MHIHRSHAPVSAKKTPKNSAKASPKNKPALKASGTASSAHQVNDLDMTSNVMLKHPPTVAREQESEHGSDITEPLDLNIATIAQESHDDSDSSDASSLNKKPRAKSLASASSHRDSGPKDNIDSNMMSLFEQITPPTFMLGHSEAAGIFDTNCARRKIEFHNSNWPIVCHFYTT